MLYKFKSQAASDLIMLDPNGRRVLEIIGKTPGPRGIIEPPDMATAVRALEAAVQAEEAARQAAVAEAEARGEDPPVFEGVTLRQRAAPFIELLRRSAQADVPVVWGV